MTQHTSSSSSSSTSSTPTGPLLLFLALCLFFQLPAFTKANAPPSASTSPTTLAPTLIPQEPQPQTIPPQAQKIPVDSNHTHLNELKLELRAAAPEPQFVTITATGIYSQEPQYTPYTTQVIITQYVTPAITTQYITPAVVPVTTYYTPSQQHQTSTTTTTLPAGFIPIAAGGYYCSTLYAQGPGLPTTRQGNCGNILVESSPVAAQPSNSGASASKIVGEGVIGGAGGKSMLAMVLVLAVGVAGLG